MIDNGTGGVCGHVTAYSEAWEYATISPMEVLLHDMEETLGVTVSLPDGNDTDVLSFQQQIVDISQDCNQAAQVSPRAMEKTKVDPTCEQGDEGVDEDVMSCMGRKMSHDTAYTAETETEDKESLRKISPPTSPALPTSPAPSQQMSVVNLNNVAMKWNEAQEDKPEKYCREQDQKRTTHQQDAKGVGSTIHVQEGLKAKC